MSVSIETLALAKKFAKGYTDDAITQLPKGLVYRGAVNTYSDLENIQAEVGDVYTVLESELEYAWGPRDNVNQWICLGPDMSQYQEKLVSGTNIKTVNGSTLLGSGDLVIDTNKAFPSSWPTTGSTTTKQFCDVVNADTSAVQGLSYLGEVRWSDLPSTMVNGEVIVQIMSGTGSSNKVILLTITSGNLAPYMWKYTYWNNGNNVSGWIGFQTELVSGTNIKTINNNSLLGSGNINLISVNPTLAGTEADLTGLEVGSTKYKVPQGTPVTANPTLAGTENALTGLEVNGTKYKVPEIKTGLNKYGVSENIDDGDLYCSPTNVFTFTQQTIITGATYTVLDVGLASNQAMPTNIVLPKYASADSTITRVVGAIANNGFMQATQTTTLKSVVLSDGIIVIGDHAFENNNGLTQITIPESVEEISNTAFSGCDSLTKIIINSPKGTILDASNNHWGATNAEVYWSDSAVVSDSVKYIKRTLDASDNPVDVKSEMTFMKVSLAAYNQMATKDDNTFYMIMTE